MDRRDVLKRIGAVGTASALSSATPFPWGETAPAGRPAAASPNIVMLFADDLGYGDLSSFGHPLIRTPRIDSIGEHGARLTSFYVGAPACTPARASLLTGRYPMRVGLPRVILSDAPRGMPDSEVTVAEALKKQGYRTQIVGKWHLGDQEEYLPTHHGFDHFFGTPYSHDIEAPWVEQANEPVPLMRDTDIVEQPVDPATLTERYTEEATRFIRASSTDPFFLYLPYNMPHLPLAVPERFQGRSQAGLYGDVVEMVDWSVGRILDVLEEQGLTENTLVAFASDNGPWLNLPDRMLQGGVEPWHVGSPGLLRGAKGTTYEGGLRVPALVQWPSQIPAGQVSADITTSMDLYVTFVTAAGGTVPSDRPIDGYDLLPFLTGERDASPTDEFFYYLGNNLEAVREGPWKLRLSNNARPGNHHPPLPELYHLGRDPSERYNRAEELPDRVAHLTRRLHSRAEEIDDTQLHF